MNIVYFGIENPEVRALGELAELERRQEGFEQFISDSIYNGELDLLAEEIEYDLEETLDRFEEIKSVLEELGAQHVINQLGEIEKWITQILKEISSVNIFELDIEETQIALTEALVAAFEINTFFLYIEQLVRDHIAEQELSQME